MRGVALLCFLVSLCAWADPETLTGRYRAMTLSQSERKELRAVGLERVTASSGECLEEGMALDSVETMFVQATCPGVRTSIAWLKGSVRIHILMCSEPEDMPPPLVKLRAKAQREVKPYRGVTACVRGPEVHLLGWAATPSERAKLAAVAKKLGLVDKVELLGELERQDDPTGENK